MTSIAVNGSADLLTNGENKLQNSKNKNKKNETEKLKRK